MIVNELLTYAIHHIDNSSLDNIKKLMLNFYTSEEILDARKILWEVCGNSLDNFIERKTTDKRSSEEANLHDILTALINLNSNDLTPNFVAKNLNRLLYETPENLNLTSLLQRIINLEKISRISEEAISLHTIHISDLQSINADRKIERLENKIQEHGVALSDIIVKYNNTTSPEADTSLLQPELSSDVISESDWVDVDPDAVDFTDRPRFVYDKLILENRNKNRKLNKPKKRKSLNNKGLCSFKNNSINQKPNNIILNHNKDNNNNNNRKLIYDKLEGAPIIKKDLYIGNVASGSEISIGDYIKSNGLNFIDIVRVSREFSRFKSFRLTVSLNEYNYFLRSNFWPTGIIVKPWINFKDKKRYGVREYFNKNFNPKKF